MKSQTALIIEDHPDLSRIFSITLESTGFLTECILDGQQALTYLAKTVPDLIILDLHLPGVSGADIWETIDGDERFASTATIVVSGDHLLGDQLRSKVDLVLLKPVEPLQLKRLSERACQIHQKPEGKGPTQGAEQSSAQVEMLALPGTNGVQGKGASLR